MKVILVGSGTRDPEDVDFGGLDINRELNEDLQTKLVDPLRLAARANVVVHRVENCTVHAKLFLIDDGSPTSGRRTCSAGRCAAPTAR